MLIRRGVGSLQYSVVILLIISLSCWNGILGNGLDFRSRLWCKEGDCNSGSSHSSTALGHSRCLLPNISRRFAQTLEIRTPWQLWGVHIALRFELQSSRIVCFFFLFFIAGFVSGLLLVIIAVQENLQMDQNWWDLLGIHVGFFFPGLSMVSRRQCCCGWWMRWSEMHSSCWSPWKV